MGVRTAGAIIIAGLLTILGTTNLLESKESEIRYKIEREGRLYPYENCSWIIDAGKKEIHLWPSECGNKIHDDQRVFYRSLRGLRLEGYCVEDFCKKCSTGYLREDN
jgi:hypothetical protein